MTPASSTPSSADETTSSCEAANLYRYVVVIACAANAISCR